MMYDKRPIEKEESFLFKNSGMPLYLQLKNMLRERIRKEYTPGDLLPPENALVQQYKVSRITVRKAIEELEKEDILIKKQGKGTFVKEQKVVFNANYIGSLTRRLAKQNRQLQTSLLEYQTLTGDHPVLHTLQCDKVLQIKRVRVLDGIPFAIMLNYLVEDRVPGLRERFTTRALYTFLQDEYGLVLHHATETIEAKGADSEEAALLKLEEGFPLLRLHKLSYDADNTPLELSDIVLRSDMYKHQIRLTMDKGHQA